MLEIFEFKRPVDFLKAYMESLPPQKKRGIRNRLSKAAGVFPSYFSLILREKRTLNSDQALGIANYLSLDVSKKRYFLRLTELEKAATPQLRNELEIELEELRLNNSQISGFVAYEKVKLSVDDLTKFYSSWVYTAVRLATSLPSCENISGIARRLGLSLDECQTVMEFLLENGLCVRRGKGYAVGPTHMHLSHDSPLIDTHHGQWRLQALQRHRRMNHSKELAYSFVCGLSQDDVLKIRHLLLKAIQEVRLVTDPSDSETLYLLNLDWLQL